MKRIGYCYQLYDIVRIDHFRGFEAYFSVPCGAKTAIGGHWEPGPDYELFDVMKRRLGEKEVIAEDLGVITPPVRRMIEKTGFPGMKVLQFAFNGQDAPDLPHNYPQHCVAYPGTHDNNTLAGWWNEELSEAGKKQATAYLALSKREGIQQGLLRGVLSSSADIAVIPMADWLGLGSECRINTPGEPQGYWRWRALPAALTPGTAVHIREVCARYFRAAPAPATKSKKQ